MEAEILVKAAEAKGDHAHQLRGIELHSGGWGDVGGIGDIGAGVDASIGAGGGGDAGDDASGGMHTGSDTGPGADAISEMRAEEWGDLVVAAAGVPAPKVVVSGMPDVAVFGSITLAKEFSEIGLPGSITHTPIRLRPTIGYILDKFAPYSDSRCDPSLP